MSERIQNELERVLEPYTTPSLLRTWLEKDKQARVLFLPAELDLVETALVNGAMLAMYEEDDWGSFRDLPSNVSRKMVVLRRLLMKRKDLGWSEAEENRDEADAPVDAPWYKLQHDLATKSPKDMNSYVTMKTRLLPFITPPELRNTKFHTNLVKAETNKDYEEQEVEDLTNETQKPGDKTVPPHSQFAYYGRTLFRKLALKFAEMRRTGSRFLYLHGTSGAGKSHALAALGVYLTTRGHRVVCLGDCRLLVPEPISPIKEALCFAYANDEDKLADIKAIQTAKGLDDFCRNQKDRALVFLIDQVNSLDTITDASDSFAQEEKTATRTLLDKITRYHYTIHSASGNYKDAEGRLQGSGHEFLGAFGGLDEEEEKAWWGSAEFVGQWGEHITQEHREEISAYCGMVPVLLDEITRRSPFLGFQLELAETGDGETEATEDDGEATTADVRKEELSTVLRDRLLEVINSSATVRAWEQMISMFMLDETERLKGTLRLSVFADALMCAMTQTKNNEETWRSIDRRFMWVEDEVGRSMGGLVVKKIFSGHLRFSNLRSFQDTRWYDALSGHINPSMLGYLVEEMVLSSMAVNGAPVIRIAKPPVTRTFTGQGPSLHLGERVLAIPAAFNYPYVDGIYWKVRSQKKVNGRPVVRFVGIQITLMGRTKHSEAEPQFLEVAQKWITNRGWHAELEMVWIVELRGGNERKSQYIRAETEDEFKKRKTIAEDKTKRAAARLKKTNKAKDPKAKTPVGLAGPRPAFVRTIVEVADISDKIGMKLREVRCADEEAPKDTAIRREDQSSGEIWLDLSGHSMPDRSGPEAREGILGLPPTAKAVPVRKTSARKKATAKAVPKQPQAKKAQKRAGKQRVAKQPAADSLDVDTFDSSDFSRPDAQSDTEFKSNVKATGGESLSGYHTHSRGPVLEATAAQPSKPRKRKGAAIFGESSAASANKKGKTRA